MDSSIIKTKTFEFTGRSKIFDTEASIIRELASSNSGIITKLAGNYTREGVRFYATVKEYEHQSHQIKPFITLIPRVESYNNSLYLITNFILAPFRKNDTIDLIFEDNTRISFSFTQSSFSSLDGKLNIVMVKNSQLQHMIESRIEKIMVINKKEGISVFMEFLACDQYETKEDGQLLFQIACNRVAALKQSLSSNVGFNER